MKKITILALLLTWGTATWAEENENQRTEEHKQVPHIFKGENPHPCMI